MSFWSKISCCSGEDITKEKDFVMIMSNDEGSRMNRFDAQAYDPSKRSKSRVGKGPRYQSPEKKRKKNPLLVKEAEEYEIVEEEIEGGRVRAKTYSVTKDEAAKKFDSPDKSNTIQEALKNSKHPP
jgi:hypothetical protein